MRTCRRLGAENFLSSLTYSDRFRSYRKEMGRIIGSSVALSRFEDLQEVESSRFVLRVLNEPEELIAHIRKYALPSNLFVARES